MIETQLQQGISEYFRRRFVSSLREGYAMQQRTLMAILEANADTVYGLRHGFTRLRSIDEYRQAVPLCRYESIQQLIERAAAGENGVLTKEPIQFVQLTSGSTTGQQKLIPSTSTYQKRVWVAVLALQGNVNQWARANGVPRGPGLMLASTVPSGTTSGGMPTGPVSTCHARKATRAWSWLSVVPLAATQVSDPETRRYLHWRFALHHSRLTYVSAPYMNTLLVLASTLAQRSDELIRDVADGTISSSLVLTNEQRQHLARFAKADPSRAAYLNVLASKMGYLVPRNVWPDIGWALTVHGPAFTSYERALASTYGPRSIWGLTYLASEGIIGIPFQANSYAHLPTVGATFLEFIPEDQWDLDQPKTHLLENLILGNRYEVVVTGWNGMYRYRLGDIVEVGQSVLDIPTLRAVSRRAGILSASWEKTTESQLVAAIVAAANHCNVSLVDFTAYVEQSMVPFRYRILAEIRQPLQGSAIESFLQVVDSELGIANPIYAALRRSGDISYPAIRLLPEGTFERFRQHREASNAPPEQIKILHTSSHWTFLPILESGGIPAVPEDKA